MAEREQIVEFKDAFEVYADPGTGTTNVERLVVVASGNRLQRGDRLPPTSIELAGTTILGFANQFSTDSPDCDT